MPSPTSSPGRLVKISGCTEPLEVAKNGVQTRCVVPAFMEGLEDQANIGLAEAVEEGNRGVKLRDEVCFFVLTDAADGNTHLGCPVSIARVDRGQRSRDHLDATTEGVIARWPGNRKRVEDVVVQADLD